MRTRAQQRRDLALRRLTRTNRWLTAATVVATGVLVEMIARDPLGHTAEGATVNVASSQPSSTGGASHTGAGGPRRSERLRSSGAPKSASSGDAAASSPSAPASAPAPAPAQDQASAQAPVVVVQPVAPSAAVVVSGGS